MCGILGIIDQRGKPLNPTELKRGLNMLAHRGPDGQGEYYGRNFAFGHRRLAIFDPSDRGEQPMTYRGKVIVFNGAIYNFPELKSELEKWGHQFLTETDTEVILAAYDQWGIQCVDRFNGQWAFALYDPTENIIFCSRDRFGIKPFYYAAFGGRFHFASEIKAFTTFSGWKKQLNKTRAYEFLAYGLHDHTTETLYDGVHQLPQGSHLLYSLADNSWKIEPYYNLKDHLGSANATFDEARDQFLELLRDAVQLRLRADVPIGSALSGGLDSSSVVRIMQDILEEKSVTTVSACFPETPDIDETRFIDALQREKNFQSIKVFPTKQQLQDLRAKVSWQQDEPLSSDSVIAQYLVFQKAGSEGLKVMLDGQGADEILGGYPKFYAPYFQTLLRKEPLSIIPAVWDFIHLHQWSYTGIWKKLGNYGAKSKGLIPAWIQSQFQPDPETLYRPKSVRDMRELSLQLITEMGLPALLHYEDRNAMAHGVESRLPFLDHRLVEFCLSLPDSFRIRRSRRKYILREAMRPQLPETIYQRYDKLGFEVPDWSPSDIQLKESRSILQQFAQPILHPTMDLTGLPVSTKQRIYFFSEFMQS